nr:hypothetical protein Iba_chr04dCG13870 [Ipomoea batatas]
MLAASHRTSAPLTSVSRILASRNAPTPAASCQPPQATASHRQSHLCLSQDATPAASHRRPHPVATPPAIAYNDPPPATALAL